MESEQEIRRSQLHEQLLQSQIGHRTASSHGAEDRHSKKQVCCRPAHFCAGMKRGGGGGGLRGGGGGAVGPMGTMGG